MSPVAQTSRVEVIEASDQDLVEAVKDAEACSGYTLAELAEQARGNRFESLTARMAWVAIGLLAEPGHDTEPGLQPRR